MSAKGQAFVEANSPYTGATYLVHLRLGMLENETYGHRLFIGEEKLAELCRCDRKTVQRARMQMVADGFLIQTSPARRNHPAEYEFVFPELGGQDVSPTDDQLARHPDQLARHLVPIGETSGPQSEDTPIYRNKDELKETKSDVENDAVSLEAKELCDILQKHVVDNGFKPFTEGKPALTAMDRLLRIDKHSPEEVRAVIEWCQNDSFWWKNIRSPQKLREKYDALWGGAVGKNRGLMKFLKDSENQQAKETELKWA